MSVVNGYGFRRFALYYYRYTSGFRTVKLKLITEILSGLDGKMLLDIGSGCGIFTHLAHALGYETHSLDYSFVMLKYGGGENLVNGDGCNLPFRGCLFDVVLCLDVIEHVYKPYALLTEIRRVVKMGGYVILSTDNMSPQRKVTSLLSIKQKYDVRHDLKSTHICEFTVSELLHNLSRFFEIEKIIPYNEFTVYPLIRGFVERISIMRYLWHRILVVMRKC